MDDDPVVSLLPNPDHENSPPVLLQLDTPSPAQLSLHALSGHLAFTTPRVIGLVNGHDVVVLIDGGSTHNFV